MNEGFNRVVLFGNLGADPELRRVPNGNTVLKMRLATNHGFINREGAREERTEWHFVSLWGPRGEGLSRVLHKGSFVLVEGHLQTSSYEKDGQRRYSTEINAHNVVLGGRCGPSGHDVADAAEDGDRAGDAETLREDTTVLPTGAAPEGGFEGRGAQEPEVFEPILPQRPPRGDSGAGGAAAPPPPAPRKRPRSSANQTTLAAA